MQRKGGFALFILLAVAAVFMVGLPTGQAGTALASEAQGHRANDQFDLQKAIDARSELHQRITARMPDRGYEERARVMVSDDERRQITDGDRQPLRIGLVKSLGAPPILFDRDQAGMHGSYGSRGFGAIGEGVWAATIEAPGATALRLHFEGLTLAPGTEVYLHTTRGEIFGPYTGRGPSDSGEIWSHTIAGDTVTVQVHSSGGRSSFEITEIGYVDLTKVRGFPVPDPETGEQLCSFNQPCVENASCTPISAAIQNAQNAVAHMEFVSGAFLYYCSGGLLADSDAATQIPHFLTANHCLSSNNVASSLQAFFQYEVPCNGSCPALYFYNQSPPPYPRTLGASVETSVSSCDLTLLRLSESAPAGSYFLGWNNVPVANSNGAQLYRIHHPGGAPQSYSTHTVDTGAPTCTGWSRGPRIYSRDTLGATEGGSSGSPVMNAAGQVVGQLSGCCGFNCSDECDAGSNATVDGSFAYCWSSVEPFLGSGGGTCTPSGGTCTANSQCCSGSCKGKTGRKTCR